MFLFFIFTVVVVDSTKTPTQTETCIFMQHRISKHWCYDVTRNK